MSSELNPTKTMAARKVQIESIQSVMPLRPSERKSQRVCVSNDVRQAIFSRRFHVIAYYKKMSEDGSGWVTGGWLKETLGQALMNHPMLCGRLVHTTNDNRNEVVDDDHELMEIVSNDAGVRFYEAKVCTSLMELLEMTNDELEAKLVTWEDIDQENPRFSPLSYVQVTNFNCGGYSIGFSCSLLVTDPFTFTTFLKQWAYILSKPQIPKLPLFYLPNLQKTANPRLLTSTYLLGQEKGLTVIFKTKPSSLTSTSSSNLSLDAALCIEEVEKQKGIRLDKGSSFTLIVKQVSGETKAETLSGQKHGAMRNQEHEEKRLVCEKWDGLLSCDDMVLEKGNRTACVSYWINSSEFDQGLLMVIPSLDGGKSGMSTTFIVTLP